MYTLVRKGERASRELFCNSRREEERISVLFILLTENQKEANRYQQEPEEKTDLLFFLFSSCLILKRSFSRILSFFEF